MLPDTISLTSHQKDFILSDSPRKAFIGDWAAGKTTAGAYDFLNRVTKGGRYAIFAPNYCMMRDSTLRTFIDCAEKVGEWDQSSYRKMAGDVTLKCGAKVEFISMESAKIYSIAGMDGIWLDEMQNSKAMFASRILDVRCEWATATFTPLKPRFNDWTGRTEKHWSENYTESWFRVHATIRDNPFLPSEYIDNLEACRAKYESD